MINSFAGLEMSKRALNAFRLGIQVAGHNVTNVSTEGYSRQKLNLSTTTPYTAPGLSSPVIPGQIGTGVKADEIIRIRDEFLDFQYRSELSSLGYWYKINHMYDTVQLYLAEPMGDGVRAAFDFFWGAVQELHKNPESSAIRRAMVESAKTLGAMVDSIVKGYDSYASMVNSEIKAAVDEMNGILYDIAALNKQIYAVQTANQNPNDLLDKRDLLLDRLSQMIDIDIQEPFRNGDITGEFFLTLNGRTLIQGDKVRELVAHAFYWENKVYYDVQVRDNEFDIVENTGVALALATGPEGVHQLNVYRLANGEEWTVGGEDPLCLNPNGSLKTILTSQIFSDRNVLNDTDTSTKTFTVSAGDFDVEFTLAWNGSEWEMTAVVTDGAGGSWAADVRLAGQPDVLTVDDLAKYMQDVFNGDDSAFTAPPPSPPFPLSISATSNGNSLTVTSNVNSVFITDDDGVLNTTTSYVHMRVRLATTTEALGISTSFRIQVGTQGTQVSSKVFNNPDPAIGQNILGAGQPGESYTFRIGAHSYQIDVTVKWDDAAGNWVISSDNGASPASSATERLSVTDLSNFLKNALPSDLTNAFTVNVGGTPPQQFSIASDNNWLISISDV